MSFLTDIKILGKNASHIPRLAVKTRTLSGILNERNQSLNWDKIGACCMEYYNDEYF